jgi:hypothetical protein
MHEPGVRGGGVAGFAAMRAYTACRPALSGHKRDENGSGTDRRRSSEIHPHTVPVAGRY